MKSLAPVAVIFKIELPNVMQTYENHQPDRNLSKLVACHRI